MRAPELWRRRTLILRQWGPIRESRCLVGNLGAFAREVRPVYRYVSMRQGSLGRGQSSHPKCWEVIVMNRILTTAIALAALLAATGGGVRADDAKYPDWSG